MEELKQALKGACEEVFNESLEPELSRPAEQFGDYSTNVALQLAAKLNKNPVGIAQIIAHELNRLSFVVKAESAGPGFLNIWLSDEFLAKVAFSATKLPKPLQDKEVLVEFGDPNPFKEMHIGHLYSYIVGDSVAKLLEAAGAMVRRLSYHGDIGLHVAKAIWGMQRLGAKPSDNLDDIWKNKDIGEYYAFGAKAYEEDEKAKQQINTLNEQLYRRNDEDLNKLYKWGKDQSFDVFAEILRKLRIKTDKSYLESQSAEVGEKVVRDNLGKVFKDSQGAVVYEGEKVGLHTRVFITSNGLPTYEAKDLGLAQLKNKDYPDAARSIIITAHEQGEYFQVVLAALKEINDKLAEITAHIPHGFVSLSSGKMSSRLGNVYRAQDLIESVNQEVRAKYPDSAEEVALAAIKYGFLKHRLGSDMVYDVDESISLEGKSGPYLQYAYARARSIINKATAAAEGEVNRFELEERSLARKIGEYPEVVQRASQELLPSQVSSYLYELAQNFNRFYEASRIIGDEREAIRLRLVKAYAEVLKGGLNLLNITAPERM